MLKGIQSPELSGALKVAFLRPGTQGCWINIQSMNGALQMRNWDRMQGTLVSEELESVLILALKVSRNGDDEEMQQEVSVENTQGTKGGGGG